MRDSSRIASGLVTAYAILFIFNSLTRTSHIAVDGMNYVDVARNIAAGKGIVQSTIGFNQNPFPIDSDAPAPFTAQAPLYPLTVALLTCLRIDAPTAALLVSGLAYLLLVFVFFRLSSSLYGRSAAFVSASALFVYVPLVSVAHDALSETLGVLFLMGGFLLIVRERARDVMRPGATFMAGAMLGFAFAVRYALAPSLAAGLFAVAISQPRVGRRWRIIVSRMALLSAGFALPAAPVVARNFVLFPRAMAAPGQQPARSLHAAASVVFHSLAGSYLGPQPSRYVQEAFLALSLLALAALLWRRGKIPAALWGKSLNRRSLLLCFWALAYCIFLVCVAVANSVYGMDPRLLMPAGLALILLAGGVLTIAVRPYRRLLSYAALALSLAGIYRELRRATQPASPTRQQIVARSQRLTWVATETTGNDLIAGVDTLDIPFYLGPREALFFTGGANHERASYVKMATWVNRRRARYDRVFFILPKYEYGPDEWKARYGTFIADLAAGRTDAYPALHALGRLSDATVFEVR